MKKNTSKLDIVKTLLVGFGFLSTSIAWTMYNSNVPLILGKYTSSLTLVGVIMAIDNIFAVIFQPIFGALSDRTNTRFGRRKPYILIGIPICAIFFALIPATRSILMMMIVVILFNFTMSIWRTPIIALMPDLTPEEHRSQANGIINLMGGIGSLIALAGGGLILKKTGDNFQLAFILTSLVMMVAWVVLLPVKEPIIAAPPEVEDRVIKKKDVNKQLIFLLMAIFFWFVGFNTMETFFSTYATEVYKVTAGDASLILAIFSGMFALFAVPSGFIGGKFGRKKTIMTGITILMLVFFGGFIFRSFSYIRIAMIIGGIGWALININSLPMVLELAGVEKIGTFTGFYYAASQSASVIAPPLFGFVKDNITKDINSMMIFSSLAYLGAFISMLFVEDRSKEAQEMEKAVQNED